MTDMYPLKIIEASVSTRDLIRVDIALAGHQFSIREVEDGEDEVSCSCGKVDDKSHDPLVNLAVALTSISTLLGRDITARCYSYIDRFVIVVDDILELLFDLEGKTYDVLTDRYNLTSSAFVLTGALTAGVKDVISEFFDYKEFGVVKYGEYTATGS